MFGSSDDESCTLQESGGYPSSSDTKLSGDDFSDSETEDCHCHEIDQCRIDRTIWSDASVPKSTTQIKKTDTPFKITLPKKYRRMKLKSHDDILEEQYDALKKLLDNRKNMSRKQLQEQHVSQTLNMIG